MTVAAHTPRIFIAYAPRAGLRCALVYLATAHDVYGWFTGPGPEGLESRYFVLEDYYGTGPTRCVAARDDELHSGWIPDEARCHALAELQDAFVHEWLFYRGDPAAAAHVQRYVQSELALGDVNVRFERLARFDPAQPTWTYASPGFEDGVLEALAAEWPLDYAARYTGERHPA